MFYEFLFQMDWLPLIYILNLLQEHITAYENFQKRFKLLDTYRYLLFKIWCSMYSIYLMLKQILVVDIHIYVFTVCMTWSTFICSMTPPT